MPSMMEIYKNHAAEYDELVSAEDEQRNLEKFLLQNVDWKSKTVLEAGIGTGRITKIYIDQVKTCYGFDREQHMINKCMNNLQLYSSKLRLMRLDNRKLQTVSIKDVDIFIEGWSLGHTVIEIMKDDSKSIKQLTSNLIDAIMTIVTPGGKVIIIETLGTNVPEPVQSNKHLHEFCQLLEKEHGFEKHILRTDYHFKDYIEASRIMGFFFGEEMKKSIEANEKNRIPEFTGVWICDI